MKKIFILITIIFTFFLFNNVYALDFNIYSEKCVLYSDGNLMYSKNNNDKTSIASLTKIMTAIVFLENHDNLDESVSITNEDLKGISENGLAACGFKVGEKVTYNDLMYGLLLKSGADAAQSIAINNSGSIDKFVEEMNIKAKELGMTNTHFANPVGLDDEENYSTAEDVYKMFSYALKIDSFKEIIKHKTYTTSDNALTFKSTVLSNDSSGYILGGKTGTTGDAGVCLASYSKDKDTELILITLNAPWDNLKKNFIDAKTIYTEVINNYDKQVIYKKNSTLYKLNTLYAKEDYYYIKNSKKISYYLPNDYNKDLITVSYKGTKNIKYNTKIGTKIGTITIKYDGEVIYKDNVLMDYKLHFSLLKYLKEHIYIPIIFLLVTIILMFLFIKKMNLKNRNKHKKRC